MLQIIVIGINAEGKDRNSEIASTLIEDKIKVHLDLEEQLQQKLKEAYEIARSNRDLQKRQSTCDSDCVNGRTFAIVLIGVASLFVLVMIYQAYLDNMGRLNGIGAQNNTDHYARDKSVHNTESSYEYQYQYEYQTESYDFRPYQSNDEESCRTAARGFRYNQTIKDNQSELFEGLELRMEVEQDHSFEPQSQDQMHAQMPNWPRLMPVDVLKMKRQHTGEEYVNCMEHRRTISPEVNENLLHQADKDQNKGRLNRTLFLLAKSNLVPMRQNTEQQSVIYSRGSSSEQIEWCSSNWNDASPAQKPIKNNHTFDPNSDMLA